MAPEHIVKALEAFGQIESSLGRRFEGTGLGLPLVQSLIGLHDGRLVLESELGKGTRAAVHFPPTRSLRQAAQAAG
jgi:two-component system cell cycle sensor histidine kinase PleC